MPLRVKIAVSTATSIGSPRWERPPAPAYSPSVFSRTTTKSISPGAVPASGPLTPGSRTEGR